jgi:hypothetical protein
MQPNKGPFCGLRQDVAARACSQVLTTLHHCVLDMGQPTPDSVLQCFALPLSTTNLNNDFHGTSWVLFWFFPKQSLISPYV